MHFGLLTQWYPPEPGPAALSGDLAEGLVARGHQVDVVTGFPNYPTGRLAHGYRIQRHQRDRAGDLTVHRVALYPAHSASTASRLANYGSFAISAAVSGHRILSRCDALWVNYSPITVSLAMWAARRLREVPVVTYVADLWPDTVYASGFGGEGKLGSLARQGLDRWCAAIYSSSEAVIHIARGAGDVLSERGVPRDRLHYVPTWANEDLAAQPGRSLRGDLGLTADDVVLVYAGAMGPAQGLDSLIDATADLDDRRLTVLLAGGGIAEKELKQRAAQRGCSRIRFLGRLPQDRMPDLMATADAVYVSLTDHELSAITLPSKTQAGLAAGKAMLVAAHGDVAREVRDARCGYIAASGDRAGIAAMLSELSRVGRPGAAALGRRAQTHYRTHFSTERGIDAIEEILVASARRQEARP
ncbi:MAG: glycosyltransferase family 4 protein [Phycicoccus sp.]|nr:glycosyltransferase family 4 protein [Phycicoccus sp.]